MRNTRSLVLGCLGLLAATNVVAGPGIWSGQGPYGGRINRVANDPLVTERLFASTTNGFFRSDDGGVSWQLSENGILQSHSAGAVFAFDPTGSGQLWLVDDIGRLYHTVDAGDHWLATGFAGDGTVSDIRSIAVASGTTVYLGTNTHGVLKSTDAGATFAPASMGLAGTNYPYVAVDPTNPNRLLGATSGVTDCATPGTPVSNVYRSVNAAASWTPATFPNCVPYPAHQIEFAAGNRAYFATGSLFRSIDGGATWSATTPLVPVGTFAVSPTSSTTLWLGGAALSVPDAGIYKTTDAGDTATLQATGLTTNGSIMPGIVSIALHPTYPGNARIVAAAAAGGMYVSSDDGANWHQGSEGLGATFIRAVAVNPRHSERVFAGYGDAIHNPSQALFRTIATGDWVAANVGLDAYQIRSIAIDPTTAASLSSTVMYAVGSGYTPAPPVHNGGIYKSVNGGLTWATIDNGLPVNGAFGTDGGPKKSVLLDPRSCNPAPPAGSVCTSGPLKTLYATGSGTSNPRAWRVMKSIDAGASWVDIDGLPDDIVRPDGSADGISGVTPIVMDPTDSNVLYVGAYAYAVDALGNGVYPTVPSGVFKTTDGGATWVQASTGLPTYSGTPATSTLDVLALAIDPGNPQVLWAATLNEYQDTFPGAIYKTVDGGAHWALSSTGLSAPDIRALITDPQNPGTIYAGSGGHNANPGAVYKTSDGGANWVSISVGLPASSALALALDPIDSRILHAGTNGGVYTITQLPDIDGDGVPDLIENAGPNGGDADQDGVLDSTQKTVTTTAGELLKNPAWHSGVGRSVEQSESELSTAIAAGNIGNFYTVKLVQGSCRQVEDVSPIDALTLPSDVEPTHGATSYPYDAVRFELSGCDSADVDVTFHGAVFSAGWNWRFFGPSTPGNDSTLGWHDANSLVVDKTGSTWRIHLQSGAFGSYRPAQTHAILFEGGPGYSETIFRNSFD